MPITRAMATLATANSNAATAWKKAVQSTTEGPRANTLSVARMTRPWPTPNTAKANSRPGAYDTPSGAVA